MPDTVTASVTELPESRVRIEAEVAPAEVDRRLEQAARSIGKGLKLPGFRKGKVPARLVVQRMGRAAVLEEAMRTALPVWYRDAIAASGVVPVGDPDLKVTSLPESEGEKLTFSVEIGVRPTATLGEYKGLEVPRRDVDVPDDAVDKEVEGLRERLARLDAVDREATAEDFLVIDYEGSIDGEPLEGGERRDQLVELASDTLVPGFSEQLVGAKAGDEREVRITFPDDHAEERLRGKEAVFNVAVKEVKHKRLPDLDDDFAAEAAGFDTLDELREDIRSKLAEALEAKAEEDFREAALDAAVDKAQVDVPDDLIEGRARELVDQMLHALGHRGIDKETYLKISQKSEDDLLEEAKPSAEQALRREAVLAAVVEAEGIEPSDDDLLEALQPLAEREGTTPVKLRERLKSQDRLSLLKDDLATRKALDTIASEAKPIPMEQAEARDKLWTPEKEEQESKGGKKIWTPGS
jgi:trigger factor